MATPPQTADQLRNAFIGFFAARGHHGGAVGQSDPARSDGAVHGGRHGAVQAVLRRRRGAAVQARRQLPEVRPRRRQAQRPRRRRSHQAPPRVLRDARQLQLRRLLQDRDHPVELGADHRDVRPRRRPVVDHRARQRRRGRGHLARAGRRADGSHPAPRRQGQLLADGRHRPVRPVQRDPHRPRARVRPRRRAARTIRTATGSWSSGTWSSCSTTRRPTAAARCCRSRPSTPGSASSGCCACCRASTRCGRPT